jgi:hypothetical protein
MRKMLSRTVSRLCWSDPDPEESDVAAADVEVDAVAVVAGIDVPCDRVAGLSSVKCKTNV